jgi:hypothetical protein
MAITFVDSSTNNAASGTSVTVTMPVGVQAGDYVIAIGVSSQLADVDCTEGSGTYAELADVYGNSTNDINLGVFGKIQGATPDTNVTITTRSTSGASCGMLYVLRGVDATTPIDATTTTDSSTGGQPNNPAITTATANAWVVAIAASSEPDVVTNGAGGTYTNVVNFVDGTLRNIMVSTSEIASAGAEDPGAYSDVSGTAADAWAAATVALRPAAGGATYTLDAASETYTYTASDASLEFGRVLVPEAATYTYTADDVTLSRDLSLVPDAAAYTWTADDVTLTYTPFGVTYSLDLDSAAYLWTASDVDLTYTQLIHRSLDADSADYTWVANDVGLEYSGAQRGGLTYGIGPLSPARVRAKYEEFEEIDRRIAAKEAAERETVRKQEEAKRQLAELQDKKRQTKTIAERRRKLEARIEAYQSEIIDLRTAVIAMLDETERARVELELQQSLQLQQTIADRRRRMFLLIAAAS